MAGRTSRSRNERRTSERARHRRYSVFPFFVISNDISRVCWMSTVSFISSAIRSFGAFFLSDVCAPPLSRVYRTSSSQFRFSLPTSHVRYVRNLIVTNSCTNVNAGRDGFANCFTVSLALYAAAWLPTLDPFWSAVSLFPLSFPFPYASLTPVVLFLSFSLLFLSLVSTSPILSPHSSRPHVYVVTSRIAEIPHLFSFSGAVTAGSGGTGRIARTREKRKRKMSEGE